jgi:hypothetical protein
MKLTSCPEVSSYPNIYPLVLFPLPFSFIFPINGFSLVEAQALNTLRKYSMLIPSIGVLFLVVGGVIFLEEILKII